MDPEEVREHVERSRNLVETSPEMDEENTKRKLVEPLLEILGWDFLSPEVELEYAVRMATGRTRVDYALLVGDSPAVFVEAKPVHSELTAEAEGQLKSYLRQDLDVEWGVLTNGTEFRVLVESPDGGPNGEISVAEFGLDDLHDSPGQVEILTKEAIRTGRAREVAGRVTPTKRAVDHLSTNEDRVAGDVAEVVADEVGDVPLDIEEQAREFVRNLVSALEEQHRFVTDDGGTGVDGGEGSRGDGPTGAVDHLAGSVVRSDLDGDPDERDAGSFSRSSGIFDDAMVLDEEWHPDELRERDEELDQYQRALQPVVDNRPLSNVFVYGKTGTGKTVATRHILDILERDVATYDDIDLSVVWVGCKQLTSSYQVAVALVNEMRDPTDRISSTGYSQQAVFDMLYEELDDLGGTVLVVLDEIDNIGSSDEILYGIPRARANGYVEEARPLVIGISNDFRFKDQLSPKVRDTLCEEEILFPPYDATELTSILEPRAERAFKDGVLNDDVIPLVSALAAQDSGSARQAIQLLYLSGKHASDNDQEKVTTETVRKAKDELDTSNLVEGMQRLTTQGHCVLLALASHASKDETPVRTKNLYGRYQTVTDMLDTDPIVERRVRAHLSDLSMLGIVDVYERNEGLRDGRYHEYELAVGLESVLDVLEEKSRFTNVVEVIRTQARTNDRLADYPSDG